MVSGGPPGLLGSLMRAIVAGVDGRRRPARPDLETPRTGRARNSQRRSVEQHSADAADSGEERARVFHAAGRPAGGGLAQGSPPARRPSTAEILGLTRRGFTSSRTMSYASAPAK